MDIWNPIHVNCQGWQQFCSRTLLCVSHFVQLICWCNILCSQNPPICPKYMHIKNIYIYYKNTKLNCQKSNIIQKQSENAIPMVIIKSLISTFHHSVDLYVIYWWLIWFTLLTVLDLLPKHHPWSLSLMISTFAASLQKARTALHCTADNNFKIFSGNQGFKKS